MEAHLLYKQTLKYHLVLKFQLGNKGWIHHS